MAAELAMISFRKIPPVIKATILDFLMLREDEYLIDWYRRMKSHHRLGVRDLFAPQVLE